MSKRVFTDESLETLVNEVKTYADNAAVNNPLKINIGGENGTAAQLVSYDGSSTKEISVANYYHNHNVVAQSSDGFMSATDKIKLDNTNIAYGTCSTAADVAEKAVVLDGNTQWSLAKGSIIMVKFDISNTASPVTINVNGTGAYPIWYNNAEYTSTGTAYTGYANRVITYMFNGTHYVWITASYDANSTYTNAALGQGYATCSTAAATTAKVGTLSSYKLVTGGIVSVKFTNAVPANATLNINSTGAKSIYFRGANITGDVIKAGDVATFVYSSYYHLISIDRWQNDISSLQTQVNESLDDINSDIEALNADIEALGIENAQQHNAIEELENDISQLSSEIVEGLTKVHVALNENKRNTSAEPVKAIAHRGYSVGAPENTIPAYIEAKKRGFNYVECDISWTSDGVAVLLHDDTIDRTSDGTGNIAEMTYAQALEYDFGSWFSDSFVGTKIATFEEFMRFCRAVGLNVYVDLKTTGLTQDRVTKLVEAVKSAGMAGRVTYISFYSSTALTYVKNADSNARLGYLAEVTSENLTKLKGLQSGTNEVFFDVEYHSATDNAVAIAIENDIPIEVYTVDDVAAIENLDTYITGVTSNSLVASKVLYEKYMTYAMPETPVAPAPTYTNLVPTSIDADGSVFNDVGYQNGYRLSSSGTTKAESGKTVTGFMPCGSQGVVRVAGLDWTTGGYINYYDSSFGFLGAFAYNARYEFCQGDAWTWEKTSELTTVYTIADDRIAYIRVSLIGTGDKLIVTVNEEIT